MAYLLDVKTLSLYRMRTSLRDDRFSLDGHQRRGGHGVDHNPFSTSGDLIFADTIVINFHVEQNVDEECGVDLLDQFCKVPCPGSE